MGQASSISGEWLPSAAPRARRAWRPLAAVEAWLERERDALMLWLPVGLGGGVALWFVLPARADWIAASLAAAAIGIAALALWPALRLGRAIGVFALTVALGLGLVWWRAERVAQPVLAGTIVATLTGRIAAIEAQPAHDRVRLTLRVVSGDRTLPPIIRVNADDDTLPAGLAPDAIVSIRARLLPPAPAAVPGGYDFSESAWFLGLGATGKALDPVKVVAPAPAETTLAGVRQRLSAHIEQRLSGAEGGIATAFVTGDEGAIPQDDADAMRRSGLAHLLSISGLHVTAVVAATMWLTLRLFALSPALALRWPLPAVAALAGALAGIGYTLLSGSQVPTVRSCVASLLVVIGIVMGREALTLRLVATGALVVILGWPEAVAGPSFQLSFAAVATIVAFHGHPRVNALFRKRDERIAAKVVRELASIIATGMAVEAALAPIALYHFQKAGLYGAFANIVAIPLTTFVVMPLEAIALLLDVGGLGAPAWWLAGRALSLLLWIAHHVGDAPGAVAALPSMPAGAFALMVAGGLWLLLWQTRVRRLGLLLLVPGMAWALATPPPDLIVTGDGRHLALRTADGRLALLRDRAGDYVRGMLGEAAGIGGDPVAIDDVPGAQCGADLCAITVATSAGPRSILATRTVYPVDMNALARACAAADVVVSDRRLPRACAPRWLKATPVLLDQTGGLAIRLGVEQVRMVRKPGDEHPWVVMSPKGKDGLRQKRRSWKRSAASSH